jgi:hypothetical protein
MSTIEIKESFTTGKSEIYKFFQKPGRAFLIPLYQREYSWDIDNINHLLDDISNGVEALCNEEKALEKEIRFLGTLIMVSRSKSDINTRNIDALPENILSIIDGQQRISTISILACKIFEHLKKITDQLPDEKPYDVVIKISKRYQDRLIKVFSFDSGEENTPKLKPIIIRDEEDVWENGQDLEKYYKSKLSNYIAHFINYANLVSEEPPANSNENKYLEENLKRMTEWLNDIENSHSVEDSTIPTAWEILNKVPQESLWEYEWEEISEIVNSKPIQDKGSPDYKVCSITQIISIAHYLLDRCFFATIFPTNDDWAFDMFQSLNATGTPLTAIETFRPQVVATTKLEEGSYNDSDNQKNFERIEKLFDGLRSADQKSDRSGDYLISLRVSIDGDKLRNRFSSQQKWLNKLFSKEIKEYSNKCNFIEYFGNYSDFYRDFWIDYTGDNNKPIQSIDGLNESELASVLFLMLKKNNHAMALTSIGPFYHRFRKNNDKKSKKDLLESIKIVSSFYLIWRSARSNSSLDSKYREFYSEKHSNNRWIKNCNHNFSINDLREHFKNILKDENVDLYDRKKWLEKSQSYLNFSNGRHICKALLLISAHDSIKDAELTGMIKIGQQGVNPYLKLDKWNSSNLDSIEHIAPQNNPGVWDDTLYENQHYNKVGNLTLLPLNLNKSVSNKGWKEKLIYYKHINLKDPGKETELRNKAEEIGLKFRDETAKVLKSVPYSSHVTPLTELGYEFEWNANFVDQRTKNILEICRMRLDEWLEGQKI